MSGVATGHYDAISVSSSAQSILAGFAAPPLNEALLAVQFEPGTVDYMTAATFYESVREQFPKRDEQLAQPPMGEDFAPVEPRPPVQIEVLRPPTMPRFWFVAEDEVLLLQLQHDFLSLNWRLRPEPTPYPRYETLREMIAQYMGELEGVVGHALAPNWCQVAYLNQIAPDEGQTERDPLNAVVAGVEIPRPGGFLPELEDAQATLRFLIPGDEGEPRGRVNVTVVAAVRNEDRVPIWALNLNARVRTAGERGIDGALEAFDVGHEWVARAFNELTTAEMHQRWQTLEGA